MRTAVRLYRTDDGELVGYNHPDAVELAYGENDEVETADKAAAEKLQPKPESKAEGDHEPKADDDVEPKAEATPTPKRRPRKRAAATPK